MVVDRFAPSAACVVAVVVGSRFVHVRQRLADVVIFDAVFVDRTLDLGLFFRVQEHVGRIFEVAQDIVRAAADDDTALAALRDVGNIVKLSHEEALIDRQGVRAVSGSAESVRQTVQETVLRPHLILGHHLRGEAVFFGDIVQDLLVVVRNIQSLCQRRADQTAAAAEVSADRNDLLAHLLPP